MHFWFLNLFFGNKLVHDIYDQLLNIKIHSIFVQNYGHKKIYVRFFSMISIYLTYAYENTIINYPKNLLITPIFPSIFRIGEMVITEFMHSCFFNYLMYVSFNLIVGTVYIFIFVTPPPSPHYRGIVNRYIVKTGYELCLSFNIKI